MITIMIIGIYIIELLLYDSLKEKLLATSTIICVTKKCFQYILLIVTFHIYYIEYVYVLPNIFMKWCLLHLESDFKQLVYFTTH